VTPRKLALGILWRTISVSRIHSHIWEESSQGTQYKGKFLGRDFSGGPSLDWTGARRSMTQKNFRDRPEPFQVTPRKLALGILWRTISFSVIPSHIWEESSQGTQSKGKFLGRDFSGGTLFGLDRRGPIHDPKKNFEIGLSRSR